MSSLLTNSSGEFGRSREYLQERNILYNENFPELQTDNPDRGLFRTPEAPRGSLNSGWGRQDGQFERMYYQEANRNQSMEAELREIRQLAERIRLEKNSLKETYEDFIARLETENEGLRKSEQRLQGVIDAKRRLEAEVERLGAELRGMRDSGSDGVIAELREIVGRLEQEKRELRAQLEAHRVEVARLVTTVSTVRVQDDGQRAELQRQLDETRRMLHRVEADFADFRLQVALQPNQCCSHIQTIEHLHSQIYDLHSQLINERCRVCSFCPAKDATIAGLSDRLRVVHPPKIIHHVTQPSIVRVVTPPPPPSSCHYICTPVRVSSPIHTRYSSPLRMRSSLLGSSYSPLVRSPRVSTTVFAPIARHVPAPRISSLSRPVETFSHAPKPLVSSRIAGPLQERPSILLREGSLSQSVARSGRSSFSTVLDFPSTPIQAVANKY